MKSLSFIARSRQLQQLFSGRPPVCCLRNGTDHRDTADAGFQHCRGTRQADTADSDGRVITQTSDMARQLRQPLRG
ncbi:hypothetical protein D3C71_2159950 [compost metagenome]